MKEVASRNVDPVFVVKSGLQHRLATSCPQDCQLRKGGCETAFPLVDVEEGYWVGVKLVAVGNQFLLGELWYLSQKPQLLPLAPPPVAIPGDNGPASTSPQPKRCALLPSLLRLFHPVPLLQLSCTGDQAILQSSHLSAVGKTQRQLTLPSLYPNSYLGYHD